MLSKCKSTTTARMGKQYGNWSRLGLCNYIGLSFKLLATNCTLLNKIFLFLYTGSVISVDAVHGQVDFPVSSVFRYANTCCNSLNDKCICITILFC